MMAISLWQPWASLIFAGCKKHETRSWTAPASMVGERFVIHAAQRPIRLADLSDELMELCRKEFGTQFRIHLPLGVGLGSARLFECHRAEDAKPDAIDRMCGDFAPGRFAWQLDAIERFKEPIAARGKQGVWKWAA